MNLDHLHSRVWTKDYTCNEFLCEAWKEVTGRDLKERLERFLNGKGTFKRLKEPIDPCIVFFTNGKRSSTHVGLFYCDKVLHLTGRGVQFIPLEIISMNFRETRFYK
ncbi:hypothetical protein ACRXVG_003591 [Acinetobacter baumannii]|uniref:hypothetical protein n=1 Tax=Acinetobacter baumannii TaxID=470 RepID=UPI001125EE94|nr:hypothetical protein [Acinetobacter baumannii]TPT71250.1 hypothetical protein FJU58_18295 [Acinetobacter baumannii]